MPRRLLALALMLVSDGVALAHPLAPSLLEVSVLAVGVVAAPVVARCPAWSRRIPVYATGSLAAFWWIERTAELVGLL